MAKKWNNNIDEYMLSLVYLSSKYGASPLHRVRYVSTAFAHLKLTIILGPYLDL